MGSQYLEENPFRTKEVAEQWSEIVERNEHQKSSRRDFLYPLLKRRVGELKPTTVLEIGAGQGICSSKLGNRFDSYIGVEPSEFLVERAMNKYGDKKRTFIVGDAYSLPMVTGSVDFVFSNMAWFHIKDISKASREMKRVLKKGGRFLIATAHPDNYKVWETFFTDPIVDSEKIVGPISTPTGSMEKNIIYKHSSDRILSELQDRAGLTVVDVQGFGYAKKYKDVGLFMLIEGVKQ